MGVGPVPFSIYWQTKLLIMSRYLKTSSVKENLQQQNFAADFCYLLYLPGLPEVSKRFLTY